MEYPFTNFLDCIKNGTDRLATKWSKLTSAVCMMLWDLVINGSNYGRCQVPFHSTISVVYTVLLQRPQMMVMNDLWTSSLQKRRRKTIEKTHDTNRAEIRWHGRSKFYRIAFKGKQVVFVELFRKGTVYCGKWNKSKEFRTDLVFFFVRNVFHLLLTKQSEVL